MSAAKQVKRQGAALFGYETAAALKAAVITRNAMLRSKTASVALVTDRRNAKRPLGVLLRDGAAQRFFIIVDDTLMLMERAAALHPATGKQQPLFQVLA